MSVYEIRGQNDEENLDCNITEFAVWERSGVEGEGHVQALQKFLDENYKAATDDPENVESFFPRPANGTHWHYKVIDEMDRSSYVEYSVAVQMVPLFRIAEMGDVETGHTPGSDSPPELEP